MDYYSGCGNFFLIAHDPACLHDQLSQEERAAICSSFPKPVDGLLFLDTSSRPFRMHYFNCDGTRAAMCGNGLRCIAHFAHSLYPELSSTFSLQTDVGERLVQIIDHTTLSVEMGPLPDVSKPLPEELNLYYCTMGVPHAIFILPSLPSLPIEDMARPFRFHTAFAPHGANVSYASFTRNSKGTFARLRTYERGVERETGACGTGACALSSILSSKFKAPFPFTIQFNSGEIALIEHKDERLYLTASVSHLGHVPCFKKYPHF